MQPKIYKDANHKPELAIALTPFEALCGFRPISEIKFYLQSIPELRAIIGEDTVLDITTVAEVPIDITLKKCFYNLMTSDEIIISHQLKHFIDRVSNLGNIKRNLFSTTSIVLLVKGHSRISM